MGLTSETDVREAMKLCVFDLRRGQTEGQELDKILFFYPADLPLSTQLSVIGLSEGLITFTRLIVVVLLIDLFNLASQSTPLYHTRFRLVL